MMKPRVIHPFLFGVYPILALFAHNIGYVGIRQIIIPLVITMISCLLLFFILSFIFKNTDRAGLITSFFILYFFSYGHFFELISSFKPDIWRFMIDPHELLLLFSGLILFVWTYCLIKWKKDLTNATKICNVVAACLVLISLIKIGYFKITTGDVWRKGYRLETVETKDLGVSYYPDIYYIILDAYARADVLQEIYEYDNKDFIDYLINKGFFIADKSVANYCQSVLSLAASLNLRYLDDLVAEIGVENKDRKWLTEMIRFNRVFRFLKEYGYTTVTFDAAGGWGAVKIEDADIFYKQPGLTLFEAKLIDSTPIPVILLKLGVKEKGRYDLHREKILYAFDKIEDLSMVKRPIFVFAHFLVPHQPFVFGENGEKLTPENEKFDIWNWSNTFRKGYKDNYKKQVSFVNKRVRRVIDKIIAKSFQPPIIILQADHGPSLMLDRENPDNTNLKERMAILNAYYMPGVGAKELYPSITPVNTFRIVFNYYFRTNHILLKDESYFSTWTYPYKFVVVTDKVIDSHKN